MYPSDSGLQQKLEAAGYRVAWCSDTKLSRKIDLEGWEIVVEPDAKGPDTTWLQDKGNGKIGYSRAISAVGRKFIVDHYSAYGGPKPPPIDDQGINDAFVEKASIVRYYYRGNWLELTGAD
jgi:hypothetical protein